jgi:membrane-bound lytic murein transglycosylase D
MTPRIVFAVVFALACSAASADEATNQGLALPDGYLAKASGADSAQQLTSNGPLPVVEVVGPPALPETIDLTSEPEELFQRIRQGFSMPNINNALVLHHQQWYLNHPESLRRMVERSSRYLHHIVEEIEKRGMPMELALLPMVESAYNPTAYSRSHAAGLWQFVPATGKQYKLEQNWWVDERRDIVASTAAALEYLQYIYDLHGDWHLALASYNWGEGAVGRAINKNRANGLSTDYLSLTMPEETRHYVPKLQALKNVFSNPNVLATLNIRDVPNRPYFATVTKAANIDVTLAARLAEMPVKEFVALNPAHNRPVIRSETPMVIPAHKVETFISNLEAHEESEKPLSAWQAYTLRPGEKLEEVAPRFGMTVANLKAVNGISGRIRISPGLTLLVAGQESADPADVAGLPEPQLVAEQPRLPQVLEPAPAAVATTRTHTHTVQKGETLLKVAQRYGMSLAELKQSNKLRANQVNTGTKLAVAAAEPISKVPAGKSRADVAEIESRQDKAARGGRQNLARAEVSATDKVANKTRGSSEQTRPGSRKQMKMAQYTIRRGDTLVSIAKQFRVEKDDILRWNRIQSNDLKPGQRLTIQLVQNTF